MREVLLMFGGALIGAILSWPIAHWYYRRATKETPEWARHVPDWAVPLIESLPDSPVSTKRLVELYHKALEHGDISVDPWSGYISCPRCGASSDQFESWEASDPSQDMTFRGRKCGVCGYELSGEEV